MMIPCLLEEQLIPKDFQAKSETAEIIEKDKATKRSYWAVVILHGIWSSVHGLLHPEGGWHHVITPRCVLPDPFHENQRPNQDIGSADRVPAIESFWPPIYCEGSKLQTQWLFEFGL
jgi:hypothetical protein